MADVNIRAEARVIGMGVGDDGALNRAPGIDMKVARRAIEATVGGNDEVQERLGFCDEVRRKGIRSLADGVERRSESGAATRIADAAELLLARPSAEALSGERASYRCQLSLRGAFGLPHGRCGASPSFECEMNAAIDWLNQDYAMTLFISIWNRPMALITFFDQSQNYHLCK